MQPLLPDSLPFDAAEAASILKQLPAQQSAVFALVGEPGQEPYIGIAADLRRRLARLLLADPAHPRRLQLAARVRRIEWCLTGSRLEAQFLQFRLLEQAYGERALERMHLRSPAFIRFHGSNAYPRLSVVTRLPRDHREWLYGPFASRAAAERYCEEVLKLFLLRRCEENLHPDPSHPGCVYSEMKKCLAPCFQGCTDLRYAEEATAVEQFLATSGQSRLHVLTAERDAASAALEFERAAVLHAAVRQVESVHALAGEIARPLARLEACLVLPAAQPDAVALFLFTRGLLRGPELFPTLGMRIQNEASGSSSLFAQPMLIEPVPEQPSAPARTTARDALTARLDAALEHLQQTDVASIVRRNGDLALLSRWYHRPAQQRGGEIFFATQMELDPHASSDGWMPCQWNRKAILRGIGRVAAEQLALRAQAKMDRVQTKEMQAQETQAQPGEDDPTHSVAW